MEEVARDGSVDVREEAGESAAGVNRMRHDLVVIGPRANENVRLLGSDVKSDP